MNICVYFLFFLCLLFINIIIKVEIRMQIPSLAIDIKEFRKTRRGWLGNKVKQVHLRDDIQCGFEYCHHHSSEIKNIAFKHDPSSQDAIYFIDHETLF